MADTIINTPAHEESDAAGWAVAVIILLAVIAGGFLWYRYYGPNATAPAPTGDTNINVTIPAQTTGGVTNP